MSWPSRSVENARWTICRADALVSRCRPTSGVPTAGRGPAPQNHHRPMGTPKGRGSIFAAIAMLVGLFLPLVAQTPPAAAQEAAKDTPASNT